MKAVTGEYDVATWYGYSGIQTPPHYSLMNIEVKMPMIKFRPVQHFVRKCDVAL
jgi:hypothetical protein